MFGFGTAGDFLFNQLVIQPLSGKLFETIDNLTNSIPEPPDHAEPKSNLTGGPIQLVEVKKYLGVYGGAINIGHDTHKVVCQFHHEIVSVLDWPTIVSRLIKSDFWELDWANEYEIHLLDDGSGSYAYALKNGALTVFSSKVSEFKAQISMESPLTWPEKGPREWLDSKLTISRNSIHRADLRTTYWIPAIQKLPPKLEDTEAEFQTLTKEIHNAYLADWEPWFNPTMPDNSSIVKELESLISMKASGAITETEFKKAKDQLFNNR